jgi:hypothetical protein
MMVMIYSPGKLAALVIPESLQDHTAVMTLIELKHPQRGVKLHSPGDARGKADILPGTPGWG